MAPGTPPDSTMSKPCSRMFQRIRFFGVRHQRRLEGLHPHARRVGGNQRRGTTIAEQQEGQDLLQIAGLAADAGCRAPGSSPAPAHAGSERTICRASFRALIAA